MRFLQDVNALANFIEAFFGEKVDVVSVSPSSGQMRFALYDAFVFVAGIDAQTGTFGMGLLLEGGYSPSQLLRKSISLNNDNEDISESLSLADQYCRLRLPEKYLAAYIPGESA